MGCHPVAASWRYIHISFTSNAASNRSNSTNACSSLDSGWWWAMVTCGWYGNARSIASGPLEHLGGEHLALADALHDAHEDDR